jgi:hypothetical protein
MSSIRPEEIPMRPRVYPSFTTTAIINQPISSVPAHTTVYVTDVVPYPDVNLPDLQRRNNVQIDDEYYYSCDCCRRK